MRSRGGRIDLLGINEQCCDNLFPIMTCQNINVCSRSECGDGVCADDEACSCPVDCNMDGFGGMNGEPVPGGGDRCFFTENCLNNMPPQRCGGVWKCDPDRIFISEPQATFTADGCGYICPQNLVGCNNDADCMAGDSCRPCPTPGACGANQTVCIDPANMQ